MPGEARIVALGAHDGTTVQDALEGLVTFKARAPESGGALAVFERELAPAEAVPEHVHAGQDEALYVLGGALRVVLGAHVYAAAAGAFLLIPRGHRAGVLDPVRRAARMLTVLTPAS